MGQVNITVDDRALARLDRMAKERGYSRSAYAKLLFDAAYSARCGKSGDAELEAIVAGALLLSGADFDSAAIATTLKCSEATVVRIQQAWRKAGGGDDSFAHG